MSSYPNTIATLYSQKRDYLMKRLGWLIPLRIVAIGVIGALLWIFISSFLEASPNIKAVIIGFAGTATVALITHQKTRKREIDARHFADKRVGYMAFIDLMFSIVLAARGDDKDKIEKAVGNIDMEKDILSFKKAIMVWGGSDLIQAWNDYEINSNKLQGTPGVIMEMDKLLRAIRKDLGHSDSTLKDGELVGLNLKPKDKERLLRSM